MRGQRIMATLGEFIGGPWLSVREPRRPDGRMPKKRFVMCYDLHHLFTLPRTLRDAQA
jgi:hypothetical protein